jgi:hypothetical protein
MKNLILAGLLVGSTFAFAKGEDYSLYCVAKGRNANNQKVSVKGDTFRANQREKALRSAKANCQAKGLSNCKVDYCHQGN